MDCCLYRPEILTQAGDLKMFQLQTISMPVVLIWQRYNLSDGHNALLLFFNYVEFTVVTLLR